MNLKSKTLKEGDFVEFMVFRYDPSKDEEIYYIIYEIPYRQGMTVLDGLLYILEELDDSLSLRYNCRSKICGSCAVMVNGIQRLACETQVSAIGKKIKVEPLAHFKIIKDLVVDIEPFLSQMEATMPYIHLKTESSELKINTNKFTKYKPPSDCIWCACCTSTCPISSIDPYYLGPAALSQLYHFIIDFRELKDMKSFRLFLAENGVYGVWKCHQSFACTKVCPKGINPGSLISRLKRIIIKERLKPRISRAR